MPEQRFLVVRLGSLGDIVHTFPAVAGLRESYPDAEIVWLTHPRWKPLVESSGLTTDIWKTETRSYRSLREIIGRIRKKQFTAAIDYQGLWKSAALPVLGRVSRRVGFSSQTIREFGVPILYTDRVGCTQTHIADQNGELSQRVGARNGVAPVVLAVPSIQEAFVLQLLRGFAIERCVVLSPGGGWASKCWPPDRYGALCERIHRELGLRCALNHGPGEEQLVSAIKAASKKADPVAYNGSLVQLMALLRNAVCVVGGDTGPLHLAVALGTPAVAIFGPTHPARNGPYRTSGRSGVSPCDIVLRSPRAVTTYKRSDRLAIAVLWFSRPTPRSMVLGALIGGIGLWVRAYAAGHLHKQEVLTVTGPYAYTRNPLYLGSAVLTLGTGIATRSWRSALILIVYFAIFYFIVMRREAGELHLRHGASFEDYARAVPLFIPRLTAAKRSTDSARSFSLTQYRKNHEWQAAAGFLFLLFVLLVIWRIRPH